MEELIRNAYSTGDASHIALGKDYAYWTSRLVANSGGFRRVRGVQMHPPLAASNVFLRT